MKKVISIFFALIVFVMCAIPVSAVSQKFSIAIPDYLEEVTDTQWYTSDYMINDEKSQLTVSIAFYPITEKEKQAFVDSSPYLSDTKAEIEKEPLFKEFVVEPEIKSTLMNYKAVYTSYLKEASQGEYSACSYYFFSDSEKCVVNFNSTSPLFITLDEADKIINTLSFTDDFTKNFVYTPPEYEIPTMPELDFSYEELSTYDYEGRMDEIKDEAVKGGLTAGLTFALILGIVLVAVVLISKQKEKKGKKLTTAEKVAQLTKEQQDMLYKIGKIALIVAGVFVAVCVVIFAFVINSIGTDSWNDGNLVDVLMSAVIIVMFALLAVIAAIKGRFPYWSDSNWFYLLKMRKGKVPQVCKTTETAPKTTDAIYWMPVIFDGEASSLQSPDYNIHMFPKAESLMQNGMKVPCETPFPQGYSFEGNSERKIMSPRKISTKNGKKWIPLFTDLNYLLEALSPNTHVAVVDYETACGFGRFDTDGCAGIVINPGKESKVVPAKELKQQQSYEQTASLEGPVKDGKKIAKITMANRIVGIAVLVLFVLGVYGATLQPDYSGKLMDIFFKFDGDNFARVIGEMVGRMSVYVGLFWVGVYLIFKKEE